MSKITVRYVSQEVMDQVAHLMAGPYCKDDDPDDLLLLADHQVALKDWMKKHPIEERKAKAKARADKARAARRLEEEDA